MNLKNTIFISIIILFLFQMIVSKQDAKIQNEKELISNSLPTVSISTFSLYDITKHIASNTLNINMILPFGVDTHAYEPTPSQMVSLHSSDLVIYSGAGLEPWSKNLNFKNKVIDMSKFVTLKDLGDEHSHEGHDDHDESESDPHYWLDINNMIKSTKLISEELIKLLPANKELYEKNTVLYIQMLKQLHLDYKKQLSECKNDTIIVNHNAYSYLGNNYNFKIESLSGFSPDSLPNAKNMIVLIEHAKEHKQSTIFYENFSSSKAIKNIASEANVEVDSLQPLGNITANEAEQKLSYEDIMRRNLSKISKALECK